MNLSRARQKIVGYRDRLVALIEAILGRAPVFPGSVYQSNTRCGKPQCKCATTDYRHQQWCLSYVEDGASRTRTLPPEIRAEVQAMTDEHRQLRRAERELRKTLEDLLAEWAKIRDARGDAGRQRYQRLVGPSAQGRGTRPARKGRKS